jgi:hypothetical protein
MIALIKVGGELLGFYPQFEVTNPSDVAYAQKLIQYAVGSNYVE